MCVRTRPRDLRSRTAVTYRFYLPQARKGLAVTWANTDINIPADQQEAMRQAGVEDVMKAAMDGLRDCTVGPAADCATRGGNDAGPSSMGGTFCY